MISLQRETCTEPHVEYLRCHWTRFNVVSSFNSRFHFYSFLWRAQVQFCVWPEKLIPNSFPRLYKWQNSCIILEIQYTSKSRAAATGLWKTDGSKYTIVFSNGAIFYQFWGTHCKVWVNVEQQVNTAHGFSQGWEGGKSCAESLSWKDKKEEDKHGDRGCPGWAVTFEWSLNIHRFS